MKRVSTSLIRVAVALLGLLFVSCASSTQLKAPKSEGTAVLYFRGPHIEHRGSPAEIHFVVSIIGDGQLQWCPQQIVWSFGPGAKPYQESRTLDCFDRNFENSAIFGYGRHVVRATILSNGHVAGFVEKEVIIGSISKE